MVNLTYGTGETATLLCKATGVPDPVIVWYFNDTKISMAYSSKYIVSSPIALNYTLSTLIIFNVTSLDMGTYRCVATNIAGIVSSSGEITINGQSVFYGIIMPYHLCAQKQSNLKKGTTPCKNSRGERY